jgi:hypothetical protein
MTANKLIAAAIFCALASNAAASSLLGPKGQFSALLGLEWSPGYACSKPRKPYSEDRYAWNSYRQDSLRYLSCIKEAADNDARYAVEKVSDGYNDAAQDFLNEVKSRY